MEKHSWGPMRWFLKELNNGPKQIKDFLRDYFASCLKIT
jgi:hypothetical protein